MNAITTLVAEAESSTAQERPRFASNLLLWVIVAFFGLFLLWAAFAEIDRTVRGTGRVIPGQQLQVVSHLEGGIVREILVKGGDDVQRDQPLILLDPIQAQGELGSSEAAVTALQIRITRLEAELQGREPVFPAASTPQLAQQVATEQALYISRRSDLASLLQAAEARLVQARRTVAESDAAVSARQRARAQRVQEAAALRPLVERGIEPRLSLSQAMSAADIAQAEAAGAAEAALRARAAVVEAQATLVQARQEWRSRAAAELATARSELTARVPSVPALADRVGRTTVRAPLAGRINRVLANTIAGTIRPGEPLVEIVPSNPTLLIEARIRPEDIAFVAIGQRASVAITAYDRAVYGTMEGEVAVISPDAVLDEASGETFYIVRVRTTSAPLQNRDGGTLQIGPGMVAEVDLLGDKRTILEYLLAPLMSAQSRAFREQ